MNHNVVKYIAFVAPFQNFLENVLPVSVKCSHYVADRGSERMSNESIHAIPERPTDGPYIDGGDEGEYVEEVVQEDEDEEVGEGIEDDTSVSSYPHPAAAAAGSYPDTLSTMLGEMKRQGVDMQLQRMHKPSGTFVNAKPEEVELLKCQAKLAKTGESL